ncbi:MAG: lipid-A-disaccharide synthase, partial [Cyclobacteriaceae bacterium]|nr:lipid-A-disaccharide synthase [Cyclobacteriaceae bacterium]
TGLFRVPQVCVYKSGWFEMKIAKAVVKVDHISLVNLIAGRPLIQELIQEEASEEKISGELQRLLHDSAYRNIILQGYEEIYKTLNTGSASKNAARLMNQYLLASKA